MTNYEKICQAAAYVAGIAPLRPCLALVLGSGLGGMTDSIEDAVNIPYALIPHFPKSTVPGHRGELILGRLEGLPVVVMSGRLHYYEGYSMQEVTFPIRVMKVLGADTIILSNASGGVSRKVSAGDIAVLVDHISLFGENPLRGGNLDELGPRFPDLAAPYDKEMIRKAKQAAEEKGIPLREAVYVGVPGPHLETPAEFGYFRSIGADVVGMSTVPEVIVANHMSMSVLALSVVTNEGWRQDRKPSSLEEILAAAERSSGRLELLLRELIRSLEFNS